MIQPLGDRVLVEPCEAEEKSAGGIILPESAQEKPLEGKVIAVGTGTCSDDEDDEQEMPLKEGDIVIYKKYGGTEIRIGDKEYLLLDMDSVLAVKVED